MTKMSPRDKAKSTLSRTFLDSSQAHSTQAIFS